MILAEALSRMQSHYEDSLQDNVMARMYIDKDDLRKNRRYLKLNSHLCTQQ